MSISKELLKQMGALFYEQALMEAYSTEGENDPLAESRKTVDYYVKRAKSGTYSLTKELGNHELLPQWVGELSAVGREATKKLQSWMQAEGLLDTSIAEYKYIDEKGRVHKQTPLAAEVDGKGHSYEIYHLASSFLLDDGGRSGPYWTSGKAFMPPFGWAYSPQEFSELKDQERVIYGEHPWSGLYKKDFL
jgi:hypothetical protein